MVLVCRVPASGKHFATNPAVTVSHPASVQSSLTPSLERWHKPVFILFLLAWVVNNVFLWLRIEGLDYIRWMEALLPLLALFTTLLALSRRLPLQNVLTAAGLIAFIALTVMTVGVMSGFPFGPIVFGDTLGEKLFHTVPWTIPVLWVVLIINGRGVARLIMRPWRKTNFYGFWVIGLTCLLVLCFDLGLEPFAIDVKGYWLWPLSRTMVSSWHGAPWANFLGWFITALGIMAFTIPWLINKHPVKQPTDYHPLIVWILLNAWIAGGNALHQLWLPVGVGLIGLAAAVCFAVRGARW